MFSKEDEGMNSKGGEWGLYRVREVKFYKKGEVGLVHVKPPEFAG